LNTKIVNLSVFFNRAGISSEKLFSYDLSKEHLILWNSVESTVQIFSMRHITNSGISDMDLLNLVVNVEINCDQKIVPVLHIIHNDEPTFARTTESLKFVLCNESEIINYFVTIKV